MLLATMARATERDAWIALESALSEFGARSGLFEGIEIVNKGKKESDPFQIAIKSGGPAFNLRLPVAIEPPRFVRIELRYEF